MAEMNWIPVAERLPEEKGLYFVTTDGRCDDDIIEVAFYDQPYNVWYIANNVIAWMPLPEPYEPE